MEIPPQAADRGGIPAFKMLALPLPLVVGPSPWEVVIKDSSGIFSGSDPLLASAWNRLAKAPEGSRFPFKTGPVLSAGTMVAGIAVQPKAIEST